MVINCHNLFLLKILKSKNERFSFLITPLVTSLINHCFSKPKPQSKKILLCFSLLPGFLKERIGFGSVCKVGELKKPKSSQNQLHQVIKNFILHPQKPSPMIESMHIVELSSPTSNLVFYTLPIPSMDQLVNTHMLPFVSN